MKKPKRAGPAASKKSRASPRASGKEADDGGAATGAAGHSASAKSRRTQKTARTSAASGFSQIDSLLPVGSRQRVAVGIATAVGGALLAGATLGVGPVALAGAAGYLAYRGLSGKRKSD